MAAYCCKKISSAAIFSVDEVSVGVLADAVERDTVSIVA